jgi:hypothetical protein
MRTVDPPGQDLGGQHGSASQADGSRGGHDLVDLDGGPVAVGWGQGRWSGRSAAGGGQADEVSGGEVRADRLEAAVAGCEVDDVAPERDGDPGPGRAQPDLLAL